VTAITNPLINIGGIRTRALDINVRWASPEWPVGQFEVFWLTTRLLEFSEFVPTSAGLAAILRVGTERGSPDQVFPKTKSNIILDWSRGALGATLTGRYLSGVREAGDPQPLGARTYVDAQLRWAPAWMGDGFTVALGVNNLLAQAPPACVTCALNNFDPNAYDNPGRLLYLRLSYRQ
jgi:iron complex outermembrane receptor protein